MLFLNCSHCGYSIRPRAEFLWIEHCPRCLAKRKVAVPLRRIREPAHSPGDSAGMRWTPSTVDR